jgi:hypothetical protein
VCHRSNGYLRQRSTLIARTVQHSTAQKLEQLSERGTGLSGPQEDKASNGRPASNPNGWVTWQRTGQGTVPVRCAHRQQPWPTATKVVGGYKYPPTTTTFGIQIFQRSHSIQEIVHSLQDTFPKIKPSPSLEFNSNI